MGTNLAPKTPCTHCGRPFDEEYADPIHIGKSSHGWYFPLQQWECDKIAREVERLMKEQKP